MKRGAANGILELIGFARRSADNDKNFACEEMQTTARLEHTVSDRQSAEICFRYVSAFRHGNKDSASKHIYYVLYHTHTFI